MSSRIGSRPATLAIGGRRIGIRRDEHGVVHLQGEDDLDLARGLGFAHAADRRLQMLLVRLAGRGQLCEQLRDDEESLAIDVFMRRMGFAADAEAAQADLSPAGRRFGEAYAEGVNHCLRRHRGPWELALTGYRPEPWTVADSLLTAQIMAYVGLAQAQEDLERFLIQAVHAGVAPAGLRQLFAPHLDGLDAGAIELIRRLHLQHTVLPEAVRFAAALPTTTGSNNWVLAPSRSASGHVLQCNDPHLECNRLPAVWYEFVMATADGFRIGASMPGIPGLVMGRTEHVSMGFTYGFMDMVDFFIEECRGGRYRRGDGWHAFAPRIEVIRRKRHRDLELTVHENQLGVLDTDPWSPAIADGYHLLRAWSGRRAAAGVLDQLAVIPRVRTVGEAQRALRHIPISCNWLIGDTEGNIGFQQSGLLPDRRHSGLYPLPAWEPANLWRGTVPADRLASALNPERGYLVTANGDHNQPGRPLSINLPMAPYRQERITRLLDARPRHSIGDMMELQGDLYSLQAERFLALLDVHIPECGAGGVLRAWDRRCDRDARGATVFAALHRELVAEILGRPLFGDEAFRQLVDATGLFALFFGHFDRALLTAGSPWFLGDQPGARLRGIVAGVLSRFASRVPTWGETRALEMRHILFGGRLPRWLGFDHGPVPLEGSGATVHQGGLFTAQGRLTGFGPSWRYVTDLGTARVHTALAGGPSDRRFSRWYKSDLRRWLAREYKVLRGSRRGAAGQPPSPARPPA